MEPMNILKSSDSDSYHWEQSTITWNELIVWMMEPSTRKDSGGYVLGTFRNTTVEHGGRSCLGLHRRSTGVVSRDALVLDSDFSEPGFVDSIKALGYQCLIHTTFSHTKDEPRYRIIMPFSRPATSSEYRASVDSVMSVLGKENFDQSSNQPERCMFYPATPDGSMVWFEVVEGDLIEPTSVQPGEELTAVMERIKRDPFTLPGTTGAFNRLHTDLNELIKKYALPYEEESAGRWRYKGTQSAAGVSEIAPGVWWSSHVTDPASGHAQTAFDLFRIHTFGETDAGAGPDTPIYELPSQKKAVAILEKDEDITKEMFEHDFGPDSVPAQLGYDPDSLSDGDLARHLAERGMYQKFLYVKDRGWLNWDGTRWRNCPPKDLWDSIYEEIRKLVTEWSSLGKSARQIANLKKCVDATKTRRLVDTLESFMVIEQHRLDNHPHLFNCANGTVDLQTGEVLPHNQDHYITKITPVRYRPGAAHPDWTKALSAIPEDSIEWLQYMCGQSATGYPSREDLVPILYGGGGNGKTAFVEALKNSFGEYYVRLAERAVLARDGDHSTEMMDLQGARIAVLEELPGGAAMNMKRVKDMAGASTIKARRMRENTVEFPATHTVFMTTNHHPEVTDTDEGTWRRLAMIPFPFDYRPDRSGPMSRPGDPNLKARLIESRDGQAEATLAWIIEGAVKWFRSGETFIPQPPSVVEETKRWRFSYDPVKSFLEERLEFDENSMITAAELYEDFSDWAQSAGKDPWRQNTFAIRFKQHESVMDNAVAQEKVFLGSKKEHRVLSRRDPFSLAQKGQARVWTGLRFQEEDKE